MKFECPHTIGKDSVVDIFVGRNAPPICIFPNEMSESIEMDSDGWVDFAVKEGMTPEAVIYCLKTISNKGEFSWYTREGDIKKITW